MSAPVLPISKQLRSQRKRCRVCSKPVIKTSLASRMCLVASSALKSLLSPTGSINIHASYCDSMTRLRTMGFTSSCFHCLSRATNYKRSPIFAFCVSAIIISVMHRSKTARCELNGCLPFLSSRRIKHMYHKPMTLALLEVSNRSSKRRMCCSVRSFLKQLRYSIMVF